MSRGRMRVRTHHRRPSSACTIAAMRPSARQAIPNLITLVRLALAVAFFVILAVALGKPGEVDDPARGAWGWVAVALFIVAALTDILDGWLARRWQAITVFGRVMDPFCDKLLVLGAFVFLAGPAFVRAGSSTPDSGVMPWMVVVILGRELLVTSLRGVLESMGVDFSADRWGKVKMLLQSICVPVCLFVGTREWAVLNDGWRLTRDIAVWTTVVVTAWSVVPYALRGWKLVRRP